MALGGAEVGFGAMATAAIDGDGDGWRSAK
jgi:hypothetical protein